MSSQKRSYIIVGAGVFGVSTAYELIRKYPQASVILVDRDAYDAETRVAASWDWYSILEPSNVISHLLTYILGTK
jgi:glycine/D-amino acid oxidase-like deaminating enzyme